MFFTQVEEEEDEGGRVGILAEPKPIGPERFRPEV